MRLYDALVAMIDSRVTGFIVLTQRVEQREELVEPALEDRALCDEESSTGTSTAS